MTPSKLYSRILPYTPGCPEPMVDQAVMDTVIDFATRTKADTTVEEAEPLVDQQRNYFVMADNGLELDLVLHVYGPSGELRRATPSQLNDWLPGWQTAEGSAPLFFTALTEPGSIDVYPMPSNPTGSLRMVASWRPSIEATSFPDSFGRRYFQHIVDGAKARLMSMPDVKWTNLAAASIAATRYEAGVSDALCKSLHANAGGTLTARPVRFGY